MEVLKIVNYFKMWISWIIFWALVFAALAAIIFLVVIAASAICYALHIALNLIYS